MDKFRILGLGQFRPEKNYELMLESFAQLKEKNFKIYQNCELILAGSTRDENDEKRVENLKLLS